MIIIGGGVLFTLDENFQVLQDGAVAIKGDVIEAVGNTADIKKAYPNAEFIDAKGGIIMPGIINAHTHIYSSFARGMSLKNSPTSHNFVEILENLWWRMDKGLTLEDCKYSGYMTYIESIRNGVTTVMDHHASFGAIRGSLFAIEEAAKDLGIRTSLCYEISDRLGDQPLKDSIAENVDYVKHTNEMNNDMLRGMIGFHASFTVPDKALDECKKHAQDLNCGCHFHVAEDLADVKHSIANYGKPVVNRLFDHGLLDDKFLAVHCVHINSKEMDILKEANSMVAHNVESNMGNAVGISPILKMADKGITLGMGTDAYTADVLESYKVTPILQKIAHGDPSVAGCISQDMLFKNNREIVKRIFGCEVGVLKKGAKADVIVNDYVPYTPINSGNHLYQVQFGMSGSMTNTTVINGKVVMRDRVIAGVDEKAIRAKASKLAAALWDRA